MQTSFILAAVQAIDSALQAHEAEIESLDRAIGDGDHYINVRRGSAAIMALRPQLADLPADEALQKIGMRLLSAIGGASGPLFASFFLAMAKTVKAAQYSGVEETAAAFVDGVAAIRQRGKADAGEKTMLDVLIPVSSELSRLAAGFAAPESLQTLCQGIKQAAEDGMLATRDMVATKGRAAFLGERAIGHIDAGAKSSQVMIAAVCDLASGVVTGADAVP